MYTSRERKEEDQRIAVISIDYMFLNDNREDVSHKEEDKHDGEETAEDEGNASGMPILVVKDRKTKMVFARVVPEKGTHPYVVKRLASDLSMLGYNKLVLKSDNEPAIVASKNAVKQVKFGAEIEG